jgi:transcriptional regulator with XRE-family HTH domain
MLVKQHSESPHSQFAKRLLLLLSNAGYPSDAESVHQALLRSNPSLRVTPLSVKNWLSGRTMPRPHSLQALSDWLRVPPSLLVFGEQEPNLLEAQLRKMDLTLEASRLLEGFMALNPHHRQSVAEVVKALNCLQQRDPPQMPLPPSSRAKRGDLAPQRGCRGPCGASQ